MKTLRPALVIGVVSSLLLVFSTFSLAQVAATSAAPPASASAPAPAAQPDRAQAYYHYSLGHIYEELVASYGRSELAGKAIDEYMQAIAADPGSSFLKAQLAELYAKSGRIGDAVKEAQQIIASDPKNIEARRLLGRIYLRSLGDPQAAESRAMLKLAIAQFQQITLLDPGSVDDHLLLGRLYRLNNELANAENEFKAAAKLAPDSEEALTSLAYLYTEEGDTARAVQALETVPEASRSARLYSALGYTYEQKRDYKQAIAAYRHALALDGDNLDSERGLAQNLLNDGQVQAALDEYKSIADADPQDAQAQLRLAEIYRQQGKFDEALAALNKAAALAPGSLEVPYNMALVYESEGRYDQAVQNLQNLLQKTAKADGGYATGEKSNRAIFTERLGMVYREQGKYPQALETFRQIIPLGDDSAERAYEQIVETYRAEKQWDQALAAAQEGAGKLPRSREMKINLAEQMTDNGRGGEGVAQLRNMLKNQPSDREIYLALAQMETSLKQFKDAEQDATQAEQLSAKPEDRDYAEFVAGSVFEREKKYEQAEQEFKTVLGHDADNAPVLNYLGYMLADRGQRLEEALGYIKHAVSLDPENGAYLDSLGWAYYKQGNYELAEPSLLKAVDKMGNDGTIQDHIASLYYKTGRLRQAVAHWQRALEEWSQTAPTQVDSADVARVTKELESTRVRLAAEQEGQR